MLSPCKSINDQEHTRVCVDYKYKDSLHMTREMRNMNKRNETISVNLSLTNQTSLIIKKKS